MVDRCLARWDVESQAECFPDLGKYGRTDVAANLLDPPGRYCPDVLALRSRLLLESTGVVRFDYYLRGKGSDGGGEGHDLDNGWLRIEDALSGDDHGGMAEAGLSTLWESEVEVDDVTRGQHRASRHRPWSALR